MDQTCVDCKRASPPSRSEHTLLSAAHGWRLTRKQNPDGTLVLEWRCPTCWNRHKLGLQPAVQPLESPRGIFRAATRLFRRQSEKPPTDSKPPPAK